MAKGATGTPASLYRDMSVKAYRKRRSYESYEEYQWKRQSGPVMVSYLPGFGPDKDA